FDAATADQMDEGAVAAAQNPSLDEIEALDDDQPQASTNDLAAFDVQINTKLLNDPAIAPYYTDDPPGTAEELELAGISFDEVEFHEGIRYADLEAELMPDDTGQLTDRRESTEIDEPVTTADESAGDLFDYVDSEEYQAQVGAQYSRVRAEPQPERRPQQTNRLDPSVLDASELGTGLLGDGHIDVPDAAQLISSMNEVLKPVLVLMRAQTELLEDGPLAGATDQAEMLYTLRDNAESALRLLDSIEQMLQLREGRLKVAVAEIDPAQMIAGIGEPLKMRAAARNHRLSVQVDAGLPLIRADYDRTVTIINDLVDNAIRYTPRDGASRLTVDNVGTHVVFSVADNGIGLTPEDLEYIGQPFWRSQHRELVRRLRGTGLRLFLARQVLELQNGALFFSGEEHVGSTFSVALPVAT
ncbi:MAG: HAMP domain-containing histidine kinase, partial [Chloroflexi bacterium]|nr:HAMP domain-containing histidine kinase [Chloroflexota bacterium]